MNQYEVFKKKLEEFNFNHYGKTPDFYLISTIDERRFVRELADVPQFHFNTDGTYRLEGVLVVPSHAIDEGYPCFVIK